MLQSNIKVLRLPRTIQKTDDVILLLKKTKDLK